jgi:NADH dehydrogenase
MRVFITAIGSSVGQAISAQLRALGHAVEGSHRVGRPAAQGRFPLSLGEEAPAGVFQGFDVVVHAAWDMRAARGGENVRGTGLFATAAAREGVTCQVFISSLSARPDAPTDYGRGKFQAESLFCAPGDYVVRPGLVACPGGLFKRTVQWVRTSPIVPMLHGGRVAMPLVSGRQLGVAVGELIGRRPHFGRPVLLFDPHVLTQREFVRYLCEKQGIRRLLLPLPMAPLLWGARAVEWLGFKPAIGSSNLRAARSNPVGSMASDLPALLGKVPQVSDTLEVLEKQAPVEPKAA